VTFVPDGRAGKGAGRCEVVWEVKAGRKGEFLLEIRSGYEVTCHLRRQSDGTWKGRWIHYEKMAIVLSPGHMMAERGRAGHLI